MNVERGSTWKYVWQFWTPNYIVSGGLCLRGNDEAWVITHRGDEGTRGIGGGGPDDIKACHVEGRVDVKRGPHRVQSSHSRNPPPTWRKGGECEELKSRTDNTASEITCKPPRAFARANTNMRQFQFRIHYSQRHWLYQTRICCSSLQQTSTLRDELRLFHTNLVNAHACRFLCVQHYGCPIYLLINAHQLHTL